MEEKPIIAVCGKGGAGKTVVSALLSRVLLEAEIRPLLLIDADPAGGLISAVGEKVGGTLGSVRDQVIAAARNASEEGKSQVANQLDYFVMQALEERPEYSLLAMGHSTEKGRCYCPVNGLLRSAIDLVITPFSAVLIDAEAGLEQINRQVIRRVTRVLAVIDGSQRSIETLKIIAGMVDSQNVFAVANRTSEEQNCAIPDGIELAGFIPEDEALRQFDRDGRSLWDLSPDNPALTGARKIAETIGFPSAK